MSSFTRFDHILKKPKSKSTDESTHLLKAEKGLFKSLRGGDSNKDAARNAPSSSDPLRTLGTFEGVFAPVSLAMFSSVLFLRIGYIVGNAGFLETILQLVIAYGILISTILSICAIATNGAVEGGGVYFMISRTLGPEFGGSIGILFYFANTVSSALYLSACTEGLIENFGPSGSITTLLPGSGWWNFWYASIINAVNLSVCLIGSALFGKTTVVFLVGVVSATCVTFASFFSNNEITHSFVYNVTNTDCTQYIDETTNSTLLNCTAEARGSFFGLTSGSPHIPYEVLKANLLPDFAYDCSGSGAELNFFTVFGVLFSGVTGIMSGANMSGELVNPSKSIPKGTLSACLFTLFTFTCLSLFTAVTCERALLQHECNYMGTINFWPPTVAIGVFLATFSASLSNLIGASRIISAVAKDFMFGPFLSFISKGTFNDNPIAAVLLSWLFVQLFLLMGSLNKIAQLSSVLFLLSYASVNLACLGLDLASAPNFRPSFRYFSWHTCLVGLIGTSTMMFFISPLFSAVGILLCLSIILALNFFSPIRDQNWGSISQALLFHQVRKYLLLLDPRKSHIKFWRPQMLLLVNNPRTSCALIDFVNALKKGGLYVIGHVCVGELKDVHVDECEKQYPFWLSLIDHLKIKAFVELTMSSSIRDGVEQLVRISGIGAMKPNTILIGFHDETFQADDFASPFSPYATNQFEGVFPPIRKEEERTSMTEAKRILGKEEFVGIIQDCLKLQKNVCICRHFSKLNKSNIFAPDRQSIFGTKAKKKLFLDVWLVDFFSTGDTDVTDTTCLFLLQLACIVNRVPRWKTRTLRVFTAIRSDDVSFSRRQEEQVQHMLELLRINAITKVISWVPDPFIRRQTLTSARDAVLLRSEETAVVFLYLPRPPEGGDHALFLDHLTALTDKWPPTILIRGVSPVTSTTL